jgi:LysR family transcriptional activator of glutamate synthase operon
VELRQIQYFIEVAKREHVTEASYALHVAQSAVSRQIFKLEAELGVNLFSRDGRSVRLTPIGRKFLAHMEQAMQVIERALKEIADEQNPELGTVRVGFPSSLASYMLPKLISAFRKKYPRVKFELQHGSYNQLIENVSKGEMNIALIGPVPTEEKHFRGDILFVENVVALLHASHPLAGSVSLELGQLREEAFVLFPEGFILREIVVKACKQIGFEPKISFEGDDIDAIKGLVAADLGITLLPETTLRNNIPKTTVKIPVTKPHVTRSVGIITPRNGEMLFAEKLFYDFLLNFFAERKGLV